MKASKPFRFAHRGHTVRDYSIGDELPDEVAAWAINNGFAGDGPDKTDEKVPDKEDEPAKRRGRKPK